MKTTDKINIAFRSIKERFFESLMVILGLAVGIGVIASVLGLVGSFQSSNEEAKKSIWYREIRVSQKRDDYHRDQAVWENIAAAEESVDLKEEYLEEARDVCPSVLFGYLLTWDNMAIDKDSYDVSTAGPGADLFLDNGVTVRGITEDFLKASRLNLKEGSSFSSLDYEDGTDTALLEYNIAGVLFPEGDAVGRDLKLGERTFRIIGILDADPETEGKDYVNEYAGADGNRMFIPYKASTNVRQGMPVMNLTFAVENWETLDEATEQLKSFFNSALGSDKITISSVLDYQKEDKKMVTNLVILLSVLAGSGLIIAVINIFNLMLARVLRRQKNLGISQALGASGRNIFELLITESLVLGLAGGILGCGAAFGFGALLSNILNQGGDGEVIPMTGTTIIIAIGIALALTALFGIYPAYKASKTNPSEALRLNN